MCVRRKKSVQSKKDAKTRNDLAGKQQTPTPHSQTPQTPGDRRPQTLSANKSDHRGVDRAQSKPSEKSPPRVEEKKDSQPIKIRPPRVIKARRPMKEVKEARDPEYKTLEPDFSDWDSVKLLKKSEINMEELQREVRRGVENTQN
ncbi:hypothetical protein Q1695_003964 [Nippostrongylus brasiliensis]|nr:hypothetical protein Q1695_003964 [Nippostrongylus brasiliensis]